MGGVLYLSQALADRAEFSLRQMRTGPGMPPLVVARSPSQAAWHGHAGLRFPAFLARSPASRTGGSPLALQMPPNRKAVQRDTSTALPAPLGTQSALERLRSPPDLFHPPFRRSPRRLLSHQRRRKDFSKLGMTHRLVETLSGPGPFTIFIPTDAAFDRLSDDQQANLFADPGKLAKVLKYHIVPGYYSADDLLDRLFLKTLEGQRLRVWSDVSEVPVGEEEIATGGDALSYISSDPVTTSVRESIKINGGHVLQANVIADNGIMHVIDKVLIPQFTML